MLNACLILPTTPTTTPASGRVREAGVGVQVRHADGLGYAGNVFLCFPVLDAGIFRTTWFTFRAGVLCSSTDCRDNGDRNATP